MPPKPQPIIIGLRDVLENENIQRYLRISNLARQQFPLQYSSKFLLPKHSPLNFTARGNLISAMSFFSVEAMYLGWTILRLDLRVRDPVSFRSIRVAPNLSM
jgi:hypothetical protein